MIRKAAGEALGQRGSVCLECGANLELNGQRERKTLGGWLCQSVHFNRGEGAGRRPTDFARA